MQRAVLALIDSVCVCLCVSARHSQNDSSYDRANRASRVIQSHPYGVGRTPEWSVVVRYNNVDLHFWNVFRYSDHTGNPQIRRFLSLRCDDSSPRKAAEYLEIIYCQKLQSLTYIFAVDSGYIFITFQFSHNNLRKSNPLSRIVLARKPSLTWNSHSISF